MFNVGDKYIHFTKYGGVNKGEVKRAGKTTVLDTKNKVNYIKHYIVSTKNIALDLDGSDGQIFKIESELTDEQCENIINTFGRLSRRKTERQAEVEEYFEQNKEKISEALNKLQGGEMA